LEISQAPYAVQVTIYINRKLSSLCGGSIIAPSVILSAAHCVKNSTPKDLLVRAGSKYFNRGGDLHRVKRFEIHPGYNSSMKDFDISLLFLAKPIQIEKNVMEVVEISKRNESIDDGTFGLVCGWGMTMNDNESMELLRGVVIPTVNRETCQAAYPKLMNDLKICAGFNIGDRRTCRGIKLRMILKIGFKDSIFRRFWG
jgi:trypsin